jgi:ribonuclease J
VLQEVIGRASGRVVVTSFASNVHRLQQVIDAAIALDRRVAVVGRSMRKNLNIARRLGHAEVPEGLLVSPKEIESFPDERLVMLTTGSQGEPLSALRRMAHGEHPNVKLHSGDTIIFSATPIPGNERAVNETVDRLYQIGATVITTQDAAVHASGHGWSEEIKLMLNLTRPKYVMPIHGDHKRLYLHGQLAEAVGIPSDEIFRGRNGLPLEIDESGARFGEQEQTGVVFVDGVEVGDIEDVALRDRRALSADGIFIVVATVSGQDGRSLAPPEVIARGVPFLVESDGVLEDLREAIEDSLADAAKDEVHEISLLQEHVRDDVAAFIYDRLRRRPMVLPVVVEV